MCVYARVCVRVHANALMREGIFFCRLQLFNPTDCFFVFFEAIHNRQMSRVHPILARLLGEGG